MKYGQFCPIAKSLELVGERWSMLVLREVLMGGRSFNQIQRGLGDISTAILSKRLKWLEQCGLLTRHVPAGTNRAQYLPTRSAEDLQPVLMALGDWGMKWTRHNLASDDYDVQLLMLYLERSIIPERLPGPRTVIRFAFTDLGEQPDWWIVISGTHIEVCDKDPGFDVNCWFRSTLRVMTDVWLGHDTYQRAIRSGELDMHGDAALTRDVTSWLKCSDFQN